MPQTSPNRFARIFSTVGLGAAGVLALGGVAVAQDVPSNTSRPASIHAGACENPGEVVAELDNLVVTFDDDDASGGTLPGAGGDDNADDGATGLSTPATLPGSGGDDGGDDNADDQGGDDNADDQGGGDDDTDDQGGDDGGDDNTDDQGGDDGDDDGDDQGTRTGILAFQNGGGDRVGADDASVVEGSEDSDIGVNLDALIAEPHIVAVFESADADTIIACGSIGGFLAGDDDTTLAVGLREQNGSGFAGIALFDDDDDDNDLDVDVYIGRDIASGS